MTEIPLEKMEVLVHHARELDYALNSKLMELQHTALAKGTSGILVTRHGPGQFTLELSQDVPFGYTQEKS